MVDEVTQLLSNKSLKETIGKNKHVRSKLLEELNSLFLLAGDSGPSKAYNWSSSDQTFPTHLNKSSLLQQQAELFIGV